MWILNYIIGSGKVQTHKFDSADGVVDFLKEYGLYELFFGPEYLWWVVSPEGKVFVC